MTILQPLHDIARDQRIELERTNEHITDLQQIIKGNPLNHCPKCNADSAEFAVKLSDLRDNAWQAVIHCPGCKIQTWPISFHPQHPSSIKGALCELIQIWNGEIK
jgi:hypothetical protein